MPGKFSGTGLMLSNGPKVNRETGLMFPSPAISAIPAPKNEGGVLAMSVKVWVSWSETRKRWTVNWFAAEGGGA